MDTQEFPKKSKILVVDDSITVRTVVKKCLMDMGYEAIEQGKNGQEGVDKAIAAAEAGQPFNLIISDCNMPILKGIEFLRKVRGTASIASTPFILLTAENEKSVIMDAAAAGMTEFMLKPFDSKVLSEKLRSAYQKTAGAAAAAA